MTPTPEPPPCRYCGGRKVVNLGEETVACWCVRDDDE